MPSSWTTHIHTYIRMHMNTRMYAYVRTCIHRCMHAYTHTCIHTYVHACIQVRHRQGQRLRKGAHRPAAQHGVHAHVHVYVLTCMCTCIRTSMYMARCAVARCGVYTSMRTCTHTHPRLNTMTTPRSRPRTSLGRSCCCSPLQHTSPRPNSWAELDMRPIPSLPWAANMSHRHSEC